MFDSSWTVQLEIDELCAEIVDTQDRLREQEWRELVLAARWAVLHGPEHEIPGTPGTLAGVERFRPSGADGTPEIGEFACAELGLLMGVGFVSAATLIRDAADLRHRHPLMWSLLGEGKGRVWKARQVARLTHAAGLTREQAWFVDTATTPYVDTLTWSAFVRLVEARIIEADPRAAEARRTAAALERFVTSGRTEEHGLRTLIARAGAGEVVYLVAMCDRIAQIMALEGDGDPVGVRRSRALALLANPAAALALLERHASSEPHPDDPDRSPLPVPEPANTCTSCGGPRVDPERLRPRSVLHVRISEQVLRSASGVVHAESGIGPVTAEAVRELVGHSRVSVRPLLDLRGQVPVDAYEVPHAMREALRLARPSSVFPFSRASTSSPDLDHTAPYRAGGPPGQTRVGNLGPMIRFGHRVKTFGRGWRMRQPRPGEYLFRTPHGHWFRVDSDGTHALGRDPDLSCYGLPEPCGPMERALVQLVLAA